MGIKSIMLMKIESNNNPTGDDSGVQKPVILNQASSQPPSVLDTDSFFGAVTIDENGNYVIDLDGEKRKGTEHLVWMDEKRGIAGKIASLLGAAWKSMDPKVIREDIQDLIERGFPVIPTEILEGLTASYVEEFRNSITRNFSGAVHLGRRFVNWGHNLNPSKFIREKSVEHFGWQIEQAKYLGRKLVGKEIPQVIANFFKREKESFITRQRAVYVMLQQLMNPSHELDYNDIYNSRYYQDDKYSGHDYGKEIFDMTLEGEDMLQKKEMPKGLDLLGGQAFKFVWPAFNPFQKTMNGVVANLLVADDDIYAKREWKDFGIKEGDLIAAKGDVKLIDPGILRLGKKDGILGFFRLKIMRTIQEIQSGCLWGIVDSMKDDEIEAQVDEYTKNLRTKFSLKQDALPILNNLTIGLLKNGILATRSLIQNVDPKEPEQYDPKSKPTLRRKASYKLMMHASRKMKLNAQMEHLKQDEQMSGSMKNYLLCEDEKRVYEATFGARLNNHLPTFFAGVRKVSQGAKFIWNKAKSLKKDKFVINDEED